MSRLPTTAWSSSKIRFATALRNPKPLIRPSGMGQPRGFWRACSFEVSVARAANCASEYPDATVLGSFTTIGPVRSSASAVASSTSDGSPWPLIEPPWGRDVQDVHAGNRQRHTELEATVTVRRRGGEHLGDPLSRARSHEPNRRASYVVATGPHDAVHSALHGTGRPRSGALDRRSKACEDAGGDGQYREAAPDTATPEHAAPTSPRTPSSALLLRRYRLDRVRPSRRARVTGCRDA
jgi:hypothetical protein